MSDINIKSRLGKQKGNFNRSQIGLSGRIGKKNIRNRLGKNLIKSNRAGAAVKLQLQNISGTDIRNKIIAKKRQNITDARDRLAEIAKSEDARVKLNKLKSNQPSNTQNSQVQILQKGIIRKSVNNPVRRMAQGVIFNQKKQNGISYPTRAGLKGKTVMKAGALIRTVNGNSGPASSRPQVKNGKALVRAASAAVVNSDRYHPLRNNLNVVTIKNENASNARRSQNSRSSNLPMRVNEAFPDYRQQFQTQPQPSQAMPLYGNYGGPVWVQQQPMQIQEEIRPTQLRITTANNYMDYYPVQTERYEEQVASNYRPVPARTLIQKRPLYDSYEEYTPAAPKKPDLSSDIISRLDRPQRFNGNGYKIVVTNLHHVVTLEDVEELFGNIGPIKSARIVRDGVAEIIFVQEDDAYRSVEVYHNRQLDGLAMNVSVVSRRNDMQARQLGSQRRDPSPPNSFSRTVPSTFRAAPVQRTPALFHPTVGNRVATKSVLRAAGGGSNLHDSSQLYNKRAHHLDVAPDISTIHQALFCGKGNAPLSSQQFYVKLPKPPVRGMK